MTKQIPPAPPVTNKRIEHIAGEGLQRPSSLNAAQVKTLAGAVLRRVEPRKGGHR
jgi:hypothetical protein